MAQSVIGWSTAILGVPCVRIDHREIKNKKVDILMKLMLKCLTNPSITHCSLHLLLQTIHHQQTKPSAFVLLCNHFQTSIEFNCLNTCLHHFSWHSFFPYSVIRSQRFFKMSAATFITPIVGPVYMGLSPNGSKLFQTTNSVPWSRKTVSNGSRIHCMKVWNPIDNKKFETLSYLPPLTDDSIAKEIDYMMKKGWVPCLEFDSVGYVFRENSRIPNYYDGRYWTMWKLPMFGCTDSSQVLNEIQECKQAYPNAYIRCLAFDNVRQAQCMSFVIQKPSAQ